MALPKKSRTGAFVPRPAGGRKRRKTTAKTPPGAGSPLSLVPDPVDVPEGRRAATELENKSQTDFVGIDSAFNKLLNQLLDGWGVIKVQQVDALYVQIAATKKLSKLAQIVAPRFAARELLSEAMKTAATDAIVGALYEAKLQGVDLSIEDALAKAAQLYKDLDDRALALAVVMSDGLADSAKRKAISLTGGGLTKTQVAGAVKSHLEALSDRYLKDQFTGAIVTAQNSGRLVALELGGEEAPARYYISALLDSSTCKRCRADDGKEYTSLAAIMRKMPAGGNKDCLGGVRCRCAPIAVYGEATPTK